MWDFIFQIGNGRKIYDTLLIYFYIIKLKSIINYAVRVVDGLNPGMAQIRYVKDGNSEN